MTPSQLFRVFELRFTRICVIKLMYRPLRSVNLINRVMLVACVFSRQLCGPCYELVSPWFGGLFTEGTSEAQRMLFQASRAYLRLCRGYNVRSISFWCRSSPRSAPPDFRVVLVCHCHIKASPRALLTSSTHALLLLFRLAALHYI